jgi:hypothetical protein
VTQITWKNGVSGNWGTGSDWTGGVAPNSITADATIAVGGAYTVTLASSTTDTVDSVTFNNSTANFDLLGTLDLGGTLATYTFDGGKFSLGSGGSIVGGTLNIDTGTLLDQGGALSTADFILGGNASLALGGKTLTLGGTADLNGYIVGNNTAGSSVLVITGGATLGSAILGDYAWLENKATLVDAGSIVQSNFVYLGAASNDATAIIINAGATYDDASAVGGTAGGLGLEAGTATVTNAGLFEVTGTGAGSLYEAVFRNTGTLLAAAGSDVNLENGGTIGGLLTGTGEIDFDSGTFTLAPSVVINVATVGLYDGATLALNGHGTTLSGAAILNGAVAGNGSVGNTLVVSGNDTISGNAYVENDATLVDAGTITEGNVFLYLGGGNAADNSSLIINSGGVYNITTGSGGGEIGEQSGSGSIANAGLFKDSSSDNAVDVDARFVNTGTILAVAASDLQLSDGGTIGGTLAGAGEIDLTTGTFTLSPALVVNVATLGVESGATVTLGGNLSLTDDVTVNGSAIGLAGHNLTLSNALLENSGVVYGPGTVSLTGVTTLSNSFFLTGGATLVDAGTILSSGAEGDLYLGMVTGDREMLIIDAGAAYSLTTAPGNLYGEIQQNGGTGTVINAGLIDSSNTSNQGYTNYIDATLVSTGTIRSDAGALELQAGGTIGGTLAGAGEIDFDGGNFSLSPSLAVSVGTLGFDSGVVTLGGNLNLSATDVIESTGSIDLNGHNLTLANGAFSANGEIFGAGAVYVTGTATNSGLDVVNGAVLDISGTFDQVASNDGLYLSTDAAGTEGNVKVEAGGTLDLVGTGDGSNMQDYAEGASLVNYGLIASSYSVANAANVEVVTLINFGTIDSSAGDLQFSEGGTVGGALTGGGEIDFDGGVYTLGSSLALNVGTLGLGGGSTLIAGANYTYGGDLLLGLGDGFSSLSLNGHHVTAAGPATLSSGDNIDGPGTLTLDGPAVLNYFGVTAGAVLEDASTITQTGGDLYLGLSSTDSATLNIDAGAVYDLQNQGGTESGIDADGTAAINNAGLLELTGYARPFNVNASIGANFNNTGTIADLAGGELTFNGSLDNDGLITVSSGVAITNTQLAVNGALYADTGKTGTIVLGANGDFGADGSVAANETFMFTAGGIVSPQLDIGELSAFAGTITGFTAGDYIDLQHELANGFTYANNILTLTEAQSSGTVIVGTLALESVTGTLSLVSDGANGTAIVLNNPGTSYSNAPTATTNKTWNGSNAAWTTGADWSPSGVPGATNFAYINSGTVSYATTATVYQFYENGGAAKLSMTSGKLTVDDGGSSSGTIAVTGGVFDAATAYSFEGTENLSGTGTLEIDSGALSFAGGNAVLAGTILGNYGGGGYVDFGGGNVTLNAGFVFNAPFGYITGAAVTLGSSVSIAAPFDLYTGSLNLNGHSLTLSGASVLGDGNGDFNLLGAGSLAITGTAEISELDMSGKANLLVSGTALQEEALSIGNSSMDTSSISISSTGTYDFADNGVGDGIAADGIGSLTNAGLLEVTGYGNDTQNIDLRVINTGTILVTEGDLSLNGGGTLGGTIAGAGELDLAAGNFLLTSLSASVGTLDILSSDVTLGANLVYGGDFLAAGGTIDLNGHNLTLSGTGAINDEIEGSGTLKVTGSLVVVQPGYNDYLSGGAVLEDAGTIVQVSGNELVLGTGTGDKGTLIIDQGGVYELAAPGATIGEEGSGTVTNNGLFLGNPGTGAAVQVDAPFINGATGTIDVATGELQLGDGGTLGGTLAGAGELYLEDSVFTLTSGVVANIATLDINSSNVTIGSTLVYGGDLNIIGGGTLAGNQFGIVLENTIGGTGTIDNDGLIEGNNSLVVYSATHQISSIGAVLDNGGYLINASGGTIVGNWVGVALDGSLAVPMHVENSGVILGAATTASFFGSAYSTTTTTYASTGLSMTDGGTVTNLASGTIAGYQVGFLDIGGAGAGISVDNSGLIEATGTAVASNNTVNGAIGVLFDFGGSLTNEQSGTISGYLGGFVAGTSVSSAISLDNAGLIEATGSFIVSNGTVDGAVGAVSVFGGNITNELTGTIAGFVDGLIVTGSAGQSADVVNAGLIEATGTAFISHGATYDPGGVVLSTGGTLSNESSGQIIGYDALYIGNGTSNVAANFSNAGTVNAMKNGVVLGSGAGMSNTGQISAGHYGVLLLDDDLMTNQAAGTIAGGVFGVLGVSAIASTVVNHGFITGSSTGILDVNGAGTVVNAGTISGSGPGGAAVGLAAGFNNRLVIDPGAVFIGSVSGGDAVGAGGSSVVELGAGNSTFVGLGGQFTNFQTIELDSHATWAAAGSLAGETIAFGGAQATLILNQPGAIPATLAGLVAGDVIDIAATTVSAVSFGGTNLFITLSGGTVLDETLAAALPANERFAISSDGGSGSDLTLYRKAIGNIIAPMPLALGNHHVGDTVSTYLTIANSVPADGYSEALDASFSSYAGNIVATGAFADLAAGATNSTSLDIGVITSTAGSIAGNATVAFTTDGAGTDGDPALALGAQTVAVTGGVYAYASASLGTTTIALGNVHAGAVDTKLLTLTDSATNIAFTEALDASFSGTTGAAIDSGSVYLLGAGATNSTSLSVGLATGTAGALSGTAILSLASDGTGLDGLGTTALASQTIDITGSVFNYATASLANTISLGQHHTGTTASTALSLSNIALTGTYSEGLDASFSSTSITAGSFSTSGAVTTLAAGSSNSSSLVVKLGTGTAGTVTGNAVVTLTSDGAGIDTLGKTSLGTETIAVSGSVFNYATAALTTTTISLGQHHAGVVNSAAVTIKNSAAAGAYSEKLDAKFSGTSFTQGSFSTGGTISTLTAGSTSSALGVTLAGVGGVISGHATIALTSDGAGIDTLASTALTSQTVAVTGTLFNYATAALTTTTLALGQHHVGDVVTGDIVLSNSALTGLYSENLDASFSGTSFTHGTFADSGSISLLAAGATNASSLAVTLGTGAAGTVAGTATIALKSDGSGIDTLGITALTAKTVAVTGAIYNYATAALPGTVISLGVVHAGGSLSEALTLSNIAATGTYSESLDASFSGGTGSAMGSGTIALLHAGASNSSSLVVGLSIGQTGVLSGTEVLALTSDGSGIDALGTTALAPQTITITGTVDNYATAALEQISGAGTLTGGGTVYTLALGNIQQGTGSLTADLGVLNSAAAVSDLLGGNFTISNASGAFTNTSFSSFSGLAAGQADTLPVITLSGTNAGNFSELITLSSAGSNSSGYNGTLANITLDVTGNVLHTYSLTTGADTIAGVGPDLIVAQTGQLSAGDIINAGTGINVLNLVGGGTFDMRAPATLTGISIVDAQEGIGALAQTLYLDAGFAGTVNAASGTAGSSIVVYGNLDSATINLGSGNDTVYVGSSNESVYGGGGNDLFYVNSGDIGATINGGTGNNTLEVAGGTSYQMTSNVSNISSVFINELSSQSTTFTANTIANLAITGGAGNDTIILGAASQSVSTGTGNTVIEATAAQAGAAIVNNGNATLDITTGGTASLNAGDEFLTVSLSSATNLTLSPMSFITAIGSSGNDTITALAAQQTLTGGAGVDTLIGYAGFGDTFQDTISGLNGDTIQYFGGNDLIDITNLARAGASISYAGTSTAGTLSVSESGLGVVSTITLTSGTNLSAALFHLSSDGHGGTYIG